MANLVEALVEKTAEEFRLITREPAEKLWKISQSANEKGSRGLLKLVKSYHDSTHNLDDGYKSPYVSELLVDEGFDTEQVWQQIDLQIGAASRAVIEKLSTDNIENGHFSFLPASTSTKDSNKVKQIAAKTQTSAKAKKNAAVNGISDEDDSDDDDNDSLDEDSDGESDEELKRIKDRIKQREDEDGDLFGGGDNTLFTAEDDEDDDNDDDEEDMEQGDDNEEEEEEVDLPAPKKKKAKGKPGQVDDKFFKQADMEDFLDREDKREEKRRNGEDDNEDEDDDDVADIDMFASDEDETAKDFKYSDFFDPTNDGEMPEEDGDEGEDSEEFDDSDENEAETTAAGKKKVHFSGDPDFDDESDEDDEEATSKGKKKVRFNQDSEMKDEQSEETLSRHEQRLERLRRQVEVLEEESLKPKSWQLTGEVSSKDRTENSLLEVHLQTDSTGAGVPEVTEELNVSVEDIIRQRIKDKAFDDNVRQVKKVEEQFELKTKKTLNDEKSQLTLAEVYEQEYIKKFAPKEEEANPKHEEIQKMMKSLFTQLDALASWQYTPTQAIPDVKVRSNLPAIQMEEATPLTMATEGVLAPEEVKAKKKGQFKGKSERSKEDKTRERRQKKAEKRRKAAEKEQRANLVEKAKPGLGNKYAKERALKQLQKEAKGNLEVIEGKKGKSVRSSQAFFSSLQDEVTSQIKAKSAAKTKHKKSKALSTDKLLL